MNTIFPHRIIALLFIAAPLALAQPSNDPFIRGEGPPAGDAQQAPPSISMTYEVYSLPLAEAAAVLRKGLPEQELYKDLVDRTTKNQAKQEALMMIRGRSGQRIKAESISESIFPTGYDRGVAGSPGTPSVPATHAAPPAGTAYETRNCGITLEIEPTLSNDHQIADVRLAPDHTSLLRLAKWGQGISQIEMPIYKVQTINTAVATTIGSPCFLGTISPPAPAQAKNIWFAFITVDLAK